VRRIACITASPLLTERDFTVERTLREVALAHSPRVEEAGAGLVYVDVAGLQGLFGDDRRLGERLRRRAGELGLPVCVGIAGSRLAALAAARLGGSVNVVDPGEDAAHLASAPLSLLELSRDMTARLRRWGIRTMGELAGLPSSGIFERLGREGVELQRLARGEDPRPLRPWQPPPVFEASAECEGGVATLELLLARLAEPAERICERLAHRGLAADRLEWSCRLASGSTHEGSVSPAVPVNDPLLVARLLGASLESTPPRGVVEAVTLRAHPVRVPPGQGSLTDPPRPHPRLVAAVLARLAALVGPQQLGVPQLLDTHRPDAVTLAPYDESQEPSPLWGEGRVRGPELSTLALRRLRPPVPASVTFTAGRPVHLRSARLTARIVTGAGPWRCSGEWWTSSPWIHDEWDVELADGTVCRLAHDGATWSLEGIYD